MKGLNCWIHCTNSFATKREAKISKNKGLVFCVLPSFERVGTADLCKPFRLLCTVHGVKSPLQLLPLLFNFFKLTQPRTVFRVIVTVHRKKKTGKPNRKSYALQYGSKNPCRNLKSENSQDYAQKPLWNCTFMNSASAVFAFFTVQHAMPYMYKYVSLHYIKGTVSRLTRIIFTLISQQQH
jgi:hypothetical protein